MGPIQGYKQEEWQPNHDLFRKITLAMVWSGVGGGSDEGHLRSHGEKGQVERHVRRIDWVWGLIRWAGSELEGVKHDSIGK